MANRRFISFATLVFFLAMSDEGTSNKVTAESYGSLIVNDVDKECWMIRVPPKLAETWDKAEEGTVLGELVFRKGGKDPRTKATVKPALDVQVNPSATNDDPTLPLHYSLQAMTKKVPTMHPFTRHGNASITLHGTVSRTANLQVAHIQDSNYRQLCKTRLLETSVNKESFVKPVDSNQVVQQSSAQTKYAQSKGFGNAVHQYGKRLLEAANAPTPTKKAKFAEDQPTKSVIFQLFSQQQYWTVKDLKVASGGRPETEIRDTLREIGDYHRSGDHKNTWELRKEFQKQTS